MTAIKRNEDDSGPCIGTLHWLSIRELKRKTVLRRVNVEVNTLCASTCSHEQVSIDGGHRECPPDEPIPLHRPLELGLELGFGIDRLPYLVEHPPERAGRRSCRRGIGVDGADVRDVGDDFS